MSLKKLIALVRACVWEEFHLTQISYKKKITHISIIPVNTDGITSVRIINSAYNESICVYYRFVVLWLGSVQYLYPLLTFVYVN